MIRWFIRADGTKVLQYKIEDTTFNASGIPVLKTTWIDAHTEHEIPEPKKAREWMLELRLGREARAFPINDGLIHYHYSGDKPDLCGVIKVREVLEEE